VNEVLAFIGTALAALLATGAAIYTANQGKRAQVSAVEAGERESQRAVQTKMLELLSNEVEILNKRVIELRTRLQGAEDFLDLERSKRREVEQRLEELNDSVERLRNILGKLPEAANDPEVQRLLNAVPQRGGQQ
jgi:uncharacterized protein YlxW (UPF0749 family)